MRLRSVSLVTGNNLSHNPRVVKEATTLANAGFAVEVLGAWLDREAKARDQEILDDVLWQFVPVLDLEEGDLRRFAYRACTRIGQVTFRYGGPANRWQLGYTVSALRHAVRRSEADLFIAHSEAGLAAVQGLPASGRRIGVDLEDWFSEDLLPEARRNRPLRWLRGLEQEVLSRAVHRSCPSRAMSEAVAAEYRCPNPAVVYNAFPMADRQHLDGLLKDRINRSATTIHWYSQTLGPGRGLEDLFAALPHLNRDAELHLRGRPAAGFLDWMREKTPSTWRDRVVVHDLVSNGELLSRIAEHDIGFAGEAKTPLSRNLTVTNKVLHYLLGGLAVVASDTDGQKEIAGQAEGAVHLYRSGDPRALAYRLDEWLTNPDALAIARAAALRAAAATFCWERQEATLLRSVEAALAAAPVVAA
jgi:glycosyltransferase involved in cell wall biosynthesis